jgi:hypothetical protein
MANGQDKAQANVNAFIAWMATQTDETYTQIIYRGKLNRGEVAKAVGCGKSALIQNPEIKKQLITLEDGLRKDGILPPLSPSGVENKASKRPKRYDNTANMTARGLSRLSQLEKENLELKAALHELELKLSLYKELSEVMSEMGMIPR